MPVVLLILLTLLCPAVAGATTGMVYQHGTAVPTPTLTVTPTPTVTVTVTPTVTVTVTPTPTATATPGDGVAAADWSDGANIVSAHYFEETSGSRLNDTSTTCGATCDLSDNDGTDKCTGGPPDDCVDAANFREQSTAFLGNNSDQRVSCVDGTCGSVYEASTFTALCWARVTSDDAEDRIFDHKVTNIGWRIARLGGANDSLLVTLGTGSSEANLQSSGSTWPVDTWTHVGASYDGSAGHAFINGVSVVDTTHSYDPATGNGSRVNIGGSGSYMGGQIDECVYFNVHLDDAEACRITHCGIKGEKCVCDAGTPANYMACSSDAECQAVVSTAECDSNTNTCRGRDDTCTPSACNAADPS